MLSPDAIEAPFGCQQIVLEGREVYVPYLQIVTSAEELVLHHFNTLVRRFSDPYADHAEVKVDGKTKGVRLDAPTLDKCVEYLYSYRFDRFVDEQTLAWLGEVESSHIDDEFDSL